MFSSLVIRACNRLNRVADSAGPNPTKCLTKWPTQQHALPGFRVHPHHRMVRLVLLGYELLAAGTDVRAQFHHVEEFSHGFIPRRDRSAVTRLTAREQNCRPVRNDPIRQQFVLVSVGFGARPKGAR